MTAVRRSVLTCVPYLAMVLAMMMPACGSGGNGTPAAPSSAANRAPTVGGINVSPTGTGMAGATNFRFTAQDAQDPDGNSLTFSWGFGDGSTDSGAEVTHTYAGTGSFAVDLRVSDGKDSVAAPSATVTVGPNLNAAWRHTASTDARCSEVPSAPGVPQPTCRLDTLRNLNLVHSGGTLSGSLTPNVDFVPTGFVAFAFTGSIDPVSHPATVRFTTGDQPVAALQNDTLSYSFEGKTSPSGSTMTGTFTQVRKYPRVIMNPGGASYCGKRDPVVICDPDIRTNTSTFSRP